VTGELVPAVGALVTAAVVAMPRWRAGGRTPHRVLRRADPSGPSTVNHASRQLREAADRPSFPLLAAGVACVTGVLVAGPVAAVVATVYAAVLARGVRRRRATARSVRQRRDALDGLCALAADLRAGLPPIAAEEALSLDGRNHGALEAWPATSLERSGGPRDGHPAAAPVPRRAVPLVARPALQPAPGAGRLHDLARSAIALAERTGAPLAELVERVEADARAGDRAASAAAAQAAGAQATAWLLAALPLGGIALGYAIGVDPLAVLLRTPLGAACATTAVLLQLAGLTWADRLVRPAGGAR
jgi:tight adherence protein B